MLTEARGVLDKKVNRIWHYNDAGRPDYERLLHCLRGRPVTHFPVGRLLWQVQGSARRRPSSAFSGSSGLGLESCRYRRPIGAFHLSALVSQPLFGYLSDLLNRNRLIYISGTGIFLCCFFIFLSRNPILSAGLGVLVGACVLAMRTLVIAKVSDIAGAETRSAAIAVCFTFGGVMGALAPLLGGYLQQAYSYEVVFLVFGLSIFIGLGSQMAQGRLGINTAASRGT